MVRPSELTTDDKTQQATSHGSINRRQLLQTVAGGTLIGGLSGCIGSLGGGDDDTFKIGAYLPFSGALGDLGPMMLNGTKIGIDDINDEGGLDGKQVELIQEDTKTTPQTGREKAKKLIEQDQVDLLFGPCSSAVRIAGSAVADKNKVPQIYPAVYEGTEAPDYCTKYNIKTWQVPESQIIPLLPWLLNNKGDSFYYLSADYAYGRLTGKLAKQAISDQGGELVGEKYVPAGSTDFTSILSSISNKNPDVLLNAVVGTSIPAIQKQIHNNNLSDKFANVGLVYGEAVLKGVPAEARQGALVASSYFRNLPNETNKAFVKDYEDRFGANEPMNYLVGGCHVSLMMLQEAVKQAGGASPDDILEGFPKVSLSNTVAGEISMPHDFQAKVAPSVGEVNAEGKIDFVKKLESGMPPKKCDNLSP